MQRQHPISWANVAFLTLSPLAALVGGIFYTRLYGIELYEIVLFVVMFFATGVSITGGYHRHFSHASYKANTWVRNFYLIFGASAFQNSALHWAADHRLHHKHVDTDMDPYNAGRGFWWSSINRLRNVLLRMWVICCGIPGCAGSTATIGRSRSS
jgi:stearoyl-CoA desaturase (Delta-9 desaturase)